MVGARADGANDLVRLCCGKDELDVLRRLFNNFQQRVEAGRGDHVGLIDDEDLVAVANRGEGGAFTQVPGVVDTAVAGSVNFDDVERAGAATGQLDAAVACAARMGGGALGAVEAAGQDARGRGFAATAGAGKQVGVVDTVLFQGSHQRRRDMLLPDHVGKGIRTVPAIQGCWCAHSSNPI